LKLFADLKSPHFWAADFKEGVVVRDEALAVDLLDLERDGKHNRNNPHFRSVEVEPVLRRILLIVLVLLLLLLLQLLKLAYVEGWCGSWFLSPGCVEESGEGIATAIWSGRADEYDTDDRRELVMLQVTLLVDESGSKTFIR
jgi:hypothetical protein